VLNYLRVWGLSLVLALAGLGLGLLLWLEPGLTPPAVPAPPPLLSASTLATLAQVELALPGQPRLVFQRSAGGWQLTQPWAVAVNPLWMQQLLRLLQAPLLSQFNPGDTPLESFGLQNPVAQLDVAGEHWQLGGVSPVQNRRYLLRDAQTLVLIADLPYLPPQPTALAYVSPAPLGTGRELAEIWLREPADAAPRALLHAPLAPNDSADQPNERAAAWTHLQALQVRRWTAAEAPPPLAQLATHFTDGSVLHWTLTEVAGEFLLSRADLGLAYLLPPAQWERLLGGAPGFKRTASP